MKNGIYPIISNEKIAENVFKLSLAGDFSSVKPGQFANLKLSGFYLRRPLSVHHADGEKLSLIYKVVGKGTEHLSGLKAGNIDTLWDLGNGYDLSAAGEYPLIIGGGAGVPPLYFLAERLTAAGKKVSAVIGFNRKEEVFCEEELKALGVKVVVTTADGSFGVKGFVTDALPENYSYVYTCGPEPMLKAVYGAITTGGDFSFEERMGCGFGACMGCSCKTVTGYKRICKEGPVLKKEEILWRIQG